MLDSGCSILEKSFAAKDADLLARKGRKCTKDDPSEITPREITLRYLTGLAFRYLTGQADYTDLTNKK